MSRLVEKKKKPVRKKRRSGEGSFFVRDPVPCTGRREGFY